jgi:hypothetical protein
VQGAVKPPPLPLNLPLQLTQLVQFDGCSLFVLNLLHLHQLRDLRLIDRAPLAIDDYLPDRDCYCFAVLRHPYAILFLNLGNVVRLISHVLFLLCCVGFVGGLMAKAPSSARSPPCSSKFRAQPGLSSRLYYLAKTVQRRARERARARAALRGGSAGDLCRLQKCDRTPA